MNAVFEKIPEAFGTVHLLILAFALSVSAAAYFLLKRRDEKTILKLLLFLGCFMLAGEVWKQWFVSEYVYKGVKTAWFFPLQLCSMAMYCSVLVFFLKGRARNTLLVFLASYSLVAAIAALVFPGDMLRPQIALFCHSFCYHILMLIESVSAIILLSRREKQSFLPATILFICMAAAAEVVNVGSHYWFSPPDIEANMFNITPYFPSTQPVFSVLAKKLGIIPEIIIYLCTIILISFGVHSLIKLLSGKKRS